MFITQVSFPHLIVRLQSQAENSINANVFVSPQQLSANTQAQDTIARIPENLGREAPTLTPYLSTDELTSKFSSNETIPLFCLPHTVPVKGPVWGLKAPTGIVTYCKTKKKKTATFFACFAFWHDATEEI